MTKADDVLKKCLGTQKIKLDVGKNSTNPALATVGKVGQFSNRTPTTSYKPAQKKIIHTYNIPMQPKVKQTNSALANVKPVPYSVYHIPLPKTNKPEMLPAAKPGVTNISQYKNVPISYGNTLTGYRLPAETRLISKTSQRNVLENNYNTALRRQNFSSASERIGDTPIRALGQIGTREGMNVRPKIVKKQYDSLERIGDNIPRALGQIGTSVNSPILFRNKPFNDSSGQIIMPTEQPVKAGILRDYEV